jgi:hypothetical protein
MGKFSESVLKSNAIDQEPNTKLKLIQEKKNWISYVNQKDKNPQE